MVQSLGKLVGQFLKKFNTELPRESEIPRLGIYTREWNIYSMHTKTGTSMLKTASFLTAKR